MPRWLFAFEKVLVSTGKPPFRPLPLEQRCNSGAPCKSVPKQLYRININYQSHHISQPCLFNDILPVRQLAFLLPAFDQIP
jgi:hypothetical protein